MRAAGAGPTGAYAGLLGVYAGGVAAFLAWLRRTGRELPEPRLTDILLLGVATHKASRLLTKEKVTQPLREPFTEVEGGSGVPRELDQEPQGSGLRRAVGELLICPYCLAQWIGTAFFAGLAVAPRVSRFIAAMLSAIAVADFLQPAYRTAEKRAAR
jgi:Protein of unknown function (DUF1360)